MRTVDPAKDVVFLWWIVDSVKELAKDPQFIREYEEWQRAREKGPGDPSAALGMTGNAG